MGRSRRRRGYTLYELLLTLAIASAVISIGVPLFGNIVANQKLRTQSNALFHAIHLARKGSVVRRRVVSICPSLNGSDCASRRDWSAGWIVFVNVDRDSPAVRDANEPVLQRFEVDASTRIVANRQSFSLRSTDLRATNGTLIFCNRANRGTSRALVVSYTGRPRIAYVDTRGRPYQCPN